MTARYPKISFQCLVMAVLAGCGPDNPWNPAPQSQQPPRSRGRDVSRVVCVYQTAPWISFRGDPNPAGVRFNLFLASRETGKGVLADGMVRATLHRKDLAEDGSVQRTEVCNWTQDLRDVPRTKKETALGWGYQPRLYWGEVDVAGKEVEVVVWYEDLSGRPVYAQAKSLKVPSRR
ncbi:MAG: hypothetical protein ACYS7M_12125 [Planctomycetota bacterium]